VVCQVHGKENHGPLNFYRKNFFIQTSEMNQLIYSQLLWRKDSIIWDDQQLIWMALFYPLNDLLMTSIDKRRKDWYSFYLILQRGYYYFLNRSCNTVNQDNIESLINIRHLSEDVFLSNWCFRFCQQR
jgi:hypothetical protein